MNSSSAPMRIFLSGLATLVMAGTAAAQALPREVTPEELNSLNQIYLDSVVVVAGDQVVTRADLVTHLRSPKWREEYNKTFEMPQDQRSQAQNKIENDATAELVQNFLEVRAGQDRGFDPEVVEGLVSRRFAKRQESAGGYQELHRQLARQNSSPKQFKETFRRALYRHAWQGAITGKQIGTTGRKELNRYVRPGEIWGSYQSFLKSPRLNEVEMTGFREAKFETLEIAISFKSQGGRENTLKRVGDIHTDISKGDVDFEEVFSYFSRNNEEIRAQSTSRWSLGHADRVSHSEFGGSEFTDFLVKGQVGAVSKPLESKDAVHIFLLTDVEPEVPSKSFTRVEVQSAIRNHLIDKQARVRLGRAHVRLIQESQLQPPELAKYMLGLAQESMDR